MPRHRVIKVAALAEDSCDATMLRRGQNPRLYSEYLIDLAPAVKGAGVPAATHSWYRATASAALCGLALAAFGACNLQRTQKPASGQFSMNEMEKRNAAEREKEAAVENTLLLEAKSMTPEQAAAKVAALKANPQDERTYYQLMRYYEFHSDLKGKDALILWYIEHEPGGKVRPWNINPSWDRAGYEHGKRLWQVNVKGPGASAEIYDRAAAFLEGADKPLAEEILLGGRNAYPGDARWQRALGGHYAMALLGSAEPLTEYNVIRTTNPAEAQGAYARSLRAKLEKSTDSGMLAQTAQGLMIWGRGRDSHATIDTLALAEFYAARAVSLDPASELAQNITFQVQGLKAWQKLTDLHRLPAEEQKRLGDADRLRLVEFEMEQAWGPTFKSPNLDLAAGKARELLDITRRIPNDPHRSYAVFQANIMLGKVALRKGDKRESARFLLAAAGVPESEELRRSHILLNLPRTLIDWGERDAAAQFLERIAPKTLRTKEFQDWAAQIRKGMNPDMRPIMVGCGQEPC